MRLAAKRGRPRALIRLRGGLGNQLFQATFGELLRARGFAVGWDVMAVPRYHDGVGILALTWPESVAQLRLPAMLRGAPLPVRRGLNRLSTIVWRLSQNVISDEWVSLRGIPIPSDRQKIWVSGFLQNYAFVREAVDQTPSLACLDLRQPSQWVRQRERELANTDSHCIHLRRGDFGVLNGRLAIPYYAQALDALGVSRKSEFVIFSDEPNYAKDFFRPLALSQLRVIEPPKGSAAAESLALMTRCRSVIASNSTLAWWAAFLVLENGWPVVMPSTFTPEGRAQSSPWSLRVPGALEVPPAWE